MNNKSQALLANIFGVANDKAKVFDAVASAEYQGMVDAMEGALAGTGSVTTALTVADKTAVKDILAKLKGMTGITHILVDKSRNSDTAIKAISDADTTYHIGSNWDSIVENASKADSNNGNSATPSTNSEDFAKVVVCKGDPVQEQKLIQEVAKISSITLKAGMPQENASKTSKYLNATIVLQTAKLGIRRFSENSTMLLIRLQNEGDSLAEAIKAIDKSATYDKLVQACKDASEGNELENNISARFQAPLFQTVDYVKNVAYKTTYVSREQAHYNASVAIEGSLAMKNPFNGKISVPLYHTQDGVVYNGLHDTGNKKEFDKQAKLAEQIAEQDAQRDLITFQTDEDIRKHKATNQTAGEKLNEVLDALQGRDLNEFQKELVKNIIKV